MTAVGAHTFLLRAANPPGEGLRTEGKAPKAPLQGQRWPGARTVFNSIGEQDGTAFNAGEDAAIGRGNNSAQSCEYRGEGPPLRGSDQTGDWSSVNTFDGPRGRRRPDGSTCVGSDTTPVARARPTAGPCHTSVQTGPLSGNRIGGGSHTHKAPRRAGTERSGRSGAQRGPSVREDRLFPN